MYGLKPHTMTASIQLETIEPAMAEMFLQENTNQNRNIKKAKVEMFAKDIESGNWRITHQGIAFDWNGKLVDGQHRLHAIIKANKPIEMYVYRGLDPSTFSVLDTGTSRTAGDFLKKLSFSNTGTVAASVRLVLRYGKESVTDPASTSKMSCISHSQIESFCHSNYELVESASQLAHSAYRQFKGLRKSGTAAFLLLAHEINVETFVGAQRFVERIAAGADLHKGSVELAFRNYLSTTNIRTHNLNSTDFSLAILIKAWNRYVDGATILIYKPGNLQPFPSVYPV